MPQKTHAIRIHQVGGPNVMKWEEIDVPAPGPQEITLKHHAIGFNFVDTYYRTGLYSAPLPTGLGSEGAGVVTAVGSGVTSHKVGDRVAYGQSPLGALAEVRTMPAWQAVKLPAEISFEEGAAMMLKGLTVQYLFRQVFPLKGDEIILFHAAAGGVGLIACQWAKALGVRLIGTVSSEEKAEIAKAHGAWATINYSKENVAERVKELTGGLKVPVVYDGVGKDTWESSLDSLKTRGLLVSFGNASGAVTGVNLGILSQKGSLFVTRPTLAHYANTPEAMQTMSRELIDLVLKKQIRIEVNQRYALKDAAQAHLDLALRKNTGSTVFIP
jgi:NADPH2:quinone reductase